MRDKSEHVAVRFPRGTVKTINVLNDELFRGQTVSDFIVNCVTKETDEIYTGLSAKDPLERSHKETKIMGALFAYENTRKRPKGGSNGRRRTGNKRG